MCVGITYDSDKDLIYAFVQSFRFVLVLSAKTGSYLYTLQLLPPARMISAVLFPLLFIPYNIDGKIQNVLLFNDSNISRAAFIFTIDHDNKKLNYYDSIKHDKCCDKMLYDSKREKLVLYADDNKCYEWQFIR